jgi:hypothetical protein
MSINSISAIAALMRSQISSLNRVQGKADAVTDLQSKAGARERNPKNKDRTEMDMASRISLRVNSLDKDDPQRRKKAFKIFLESTIVAELGTELMNDPRFFQMIEDIYQQMSADSELAILVDQATDILLAASS